MRESGTSPLATHDPLRYERFAGPAGLGLGDAPVEWGLGARAAPGCSAAAARLRVDREPARRIQPSPEPFVALKRPSATEEAGEVYGFSLVYSGNFLAEAEVEPFGTSRVRLGIHRRLPVGARARL